jgi:hypothetical protein
MSGEILTGAINHSRWVLHGSDLKITPVGAPQGLLRLGWVVQNRVSTILALNQLGPVVQRNFVTILALNYLGIKSTGLN